MKWFWVLKDDEGIFKNHRETPWFSLIMISGIFLLECQFEAKQKWKILRIRPNSSVKKIVKSYHSKSNIFLQHVMLSGFDFSLSDMKYFDIYRFPDIFSVFKIARF